MDFDTSDNNDNTILIHNCYLDKNPRVEQNQKVRKKLKMISKPEELTDDIPSI